MKEHAQKETCVSAPKIENDTKPPNMIAHATPKNGLSSFSPPLDWMSR